MEKFDYVLGKSSLEKISFWKYLLKFKNHAISSKMECLEDFELTELSQSVHPLAHFVDPKPKCCCGECKSDENNDDKKSNKNDADDKITDKNGQNKKPDHNSNPKPISSSQVFMALSAYH